MKILRKNIDLNSDTIAVLQIEATLKGFGSVKPFLEQLLIDYATKCRKARPAVYENLLNQKVKKVKK